jgi:hypothetical protein
MMKQPNKQFNTFSFFFASKPQLTSLYPIPCTVKIVVDLAPSLDYIWSKKGLLYETK